ncbi:thaumatin-like protein 3 [Raphanus sativus]|uniref:Pathogenesis-related protein 5-like n=1 Tax=Raphanus sativus TaxID=3726 RepID=A0A9W3C4F5_RAPSA|nr:pathogenesis-related protein 5-like [Raphanus sativus]KAJ4883806.1 thaumatin-like protein 3 [Raphanus sativus]
MGSATSIHPAKATVSPEIAAAFLNVPELAEFLQSHYNVKIGIKPQGGTGDCKYAGCFSDLNVICPNELRVMDPQNNNVVACKSACQAFNKPEYCCTGAYSKTFKKACHSAYSYAYDDATSTFACSQSNYLITFCPTRS